MTVSDFLSVVALAVAIILGIANYRYTKRMFHVSASAFLDVSIEHHWNTVARKPSSSIVRTYLNENEGKELRFILRLENRSTNVAIASGSFTIYFQDTARSLRIFPRKRLLYDSGDVEAIKPSEYLSIQTKGSIENFFTNHGTPPFSQTRIIVVVKYRPAIIQADTIITQVVYLLDAKSTTNGKQWQLVRNPNDKS